MPKISVLMPVYKTPENCLREAIESVLAQTYEDFELLILDDCPDMPVEEVVTSYKDKRIHYLKNEKNLGISASRNKLIDLSKGDYLAVLDHDDVALPERFEKQASFLDAHPKVGVVGTWYETFPSKKIKKRLVVNSQIEEDLMFHCSILHPSSMIRKSVLIQNNLRYEAEFSPAEDYALWCRLIGKTKFANIPEVLQRYRDYEGNTSKAQAIKMQTATEAIWRFVRKAHPKLYQKACRFRKISILGLPLVTICKEGGALTYKFFGLISFRTREKILTEEETQSF